jgi:hypothetical protein
VIRVEPNAKQDFSEPVNEDVAGSLSKLVVEAFEAIDVDHRDIRTRAGFLERSSIGQPGFLGYKKSAAHFVRRHFGNALALFEVNSSLDHDLFSRAPIILRDWGQSQLCSSMSIPQTAKGSPFRRLPLLDADAAKSITE